MELISLNIEDFDPNLSNLKNTENINLLYTDDIDVDLDRQLSDLFDSQQRAYAGGFYPRTARDCFIIAKEKNEVIGMIFAQPLNAYENYKKLRPNYWFINYIIVKNGYTQKSIGKKLYVKCLKEISKKGATSISGDFYSNKGEILFRSIAKLLGEKLYENKNSFHLTFKLPKDKIENINLEQITNNRNGDLER